jgi:hypothetical protein
VVELKVAIWILMNIKSAKSYWLDISKRKPVTTGPTVSPISMPKPVWHKNLSKVDMIEIDGVVLEGDIKTLISQ